MSTAVFPEPFPVNTQLPIIRHKPTWKFILADSTTSPPTLIGELMAAKSRHLILALDKAGSASFYMTMHHLLADQIQPITTCIIAYKYSQPMWSGPVWTIDENITSATMTVSAVGWFELLNHRILHDQTAEAIEKEVSRLPHANVTTVPFHFLSRKEARAAGEPVEAAAAVLATSPNGRHPEARGTVRMLTAGPRDHAVITGDATDATAPADDTGEPAAPFLAPVLTLVSPRTATFLPSSVF